MAPGVFICPSNKLRTYFITLPGPFIVLLFRFFGAFVTRCDVMNCLFGSYGGSHDSRCSLMMVSSVEWSALWSMCYVVNVRRRRRSVVTALAASICRSWCRLRNRCRVVRKVNAAFRGRVESCRRDSPARCFYYGIIYRWFHSFTPPPDLSLGSFNWFISLHHKHGNMRCGDDWWRL